MAATPDGRTRFWPRWAPLAVWVVTAAFLSAVLVHLSPLVYAGARTELVQLFRAAPMLAVFVVWVIFNDANRRPLVLVGRRLNWRATAFIWLGVLVGGVIVVVSLAARDTYLNTRTDLPEVGGPLVLAIIAAIVVAVCEEVAWRGWLQPELEQYWGPLTAAVAVGFVWGLWYALIRRSTFGHALAFALMAIALSIAIRALLLAIPGQNLAIGVAVHSAVNIGMFVALPGRGEEPTTAWALTGASWLVAIALWLASRFRPPLPGDPLAGDPLPAQILPGGPLPEALVTPTTSDGSPGGPLAELVAGRSGGGGSGGGGSAEAELADSELSGEESGEEYEEIELVWDAERGDWVPVDEEVS